MPSFSAGAHINVKVKNSWTRSYSICHMPRDDGYQFAVRKSDDGRGGSKYIHEQWRQGDRLLVSEPRNHFGLSDRAERHLFIAGGIGITPFLSMIEHLERELQPWELYFCVRDIARAPFASDLKARFPKKVYLTETKGGTAARLDLKALLLRVPLGTHIYCCGPSGLMNAVRDNTADWLDGTVHFEAFNAAPPRDLADCVSFEVELKRSGGKLTVAENVTLLDALISTGIEVQWSCRIGTCGTCQIACLSGEIDHRDMYLSGNGRRHSIISCVSRGKSKLVLDI
jgi:ferredoxin-NADP reductase